MKTANQDNNQLNILRDKIEGISTTMMTTLHNDMLVSRPMESLEMDEDANIWFITALDSPKVDEILKYPFVNLAYSDPSKDRYVSISGKVEVVEDKKKLDELWSGMLKAYFPEGKDSATVKLLKVIPQSAEYWDAKKNAMVRFFEMTKSIAKGKQYSGGGENAKIESIH